MQFLFSFVLGAISLFLILLILVQRGRGGGLTGALGGMGGQSAFGTKAGDAFTRVTIISATVWILMAILAVKLLGGKGGPLGDADAAIPPATVPAAATGGATLDDLLPPAAQGSGGATSDASGGGIGGGAADSASAEVDPAE